jgi:hypothetical protein
MVMALGGCRLIHIEEEERKSLEYTVVQQEDIPKEAAALIEEKKEKEFQMTYESQGTLYLIRGYGQQMSGGYSIAVEELSCTSSAVFFKTKLIGPSELTKGDEPSYPYIVVKMDYRDEPVEFL